MCPLWEAIIHKQATLSNFMRYLCANIRFKCVGYLI